MVSILLISMMAFSANLKDGYLHDPILKTPVPLEEVERVEFFFSRIDEKLAKTPEELAYIRLKNDESIWITSQRYAIVQGKKIPITLDQEFEIMTAIVRKKAGHGPVVGKDKNEQEEVAAIKSLQIESTQEANDKKVKDIQAQLAKLKSTKVYPTKRDTTTVDPKNLPKSITPFRLVIDNQNVYLQHTPDMEIQLSSRTLNLRADNRVICNLSTVQPPVDANKLRLRVGNTSYWSEIGAYEMDLPRKVFFTSTPGGQSLCIDGTIFKSGFEERGTQ